MTLETGPNAGPDGRVERIAAARSVCLPNRKRGSDFAVARSEVARERDGLPVFERNDDERLVVLRRPVARKALDGVEKRLSKAIAATREAS